MEDPVKATEPPECNPAGGVAEPLKAVTQIVWTASPASTLMDADGSSCKELIAELETDTNCPVVDPCHGLFMYPRTVDPPAVPDH